MENPEEVISGIRDILYPEMLQREHQSAEWYLAAMTMLAAWIAVAVVFSSLEIGADGDVAIATQEMKVANSVDDRDSEGDPKIRREDEYLVEEANGDLISRKTEWAQKKQAQVEIGDWVSWIAIGAVLAGSLALAWRRIWSIKRLLGAQGCAVAIYEIGIANRKHGRTRLIKAVSGTLGTWDWPLSNESAAMRRIGDLIYFSKITSTSLGRKASLPASPPALGRLARTFWSRSLWVWGG